jgi:autotransporter passenger strand-loop-strand repeat protein
VVAGGVHLVVSSGGETFNPVISGGGTETVGVKGITSNATVGSGGVLTISSGGTLDGIVHFGNDAALALAARNASAEIAGFNRTDTLDLTAFAFQKAEILSYVENAQKTGGNLTIGAGALRATITLFGQYVAAGFHLATDGATGTDVTYTKPAPHQVPAILYHG